jgi:hypothetical protein
MVKRRARLMDRLTDAVLDSMPARWTAKRWHALVEGPAGLFVRPMVERGRKLGLVGSVTRFVLNLGDEGVTLVQLRGRQVVDAMFVAPDAEDGLATLRAPLLEDPRAAIYVVADVLEQMYREEQLPKVGRADRGNVLKRRLDITFPQDRLKAAMSLSVAKGSPAAALFASLPETEAIGHWVGFLESLPNPVYGFCLLPLESFGIAELLGPSIAGETRRVWRALVTQQATSGFRQIFESEGKLVITRLTARPPGDLTAEQVAQLIERELRSSISYIKRLGYAESDRLDLIVLSDPEICRAVESRDLPVTSATTYTPHQAGLLLGIGDVAPEAGGYSDVLHAQWLACKRRPTATLPTASLRERLQLDLAFKLGFVAAVFLTMVAFFNFVSLVFDAVDTMATRKLMSQQLATEKIARDQSRVRVSAFAVPIEDLELVDRTGSGIGKFNADPMSVMRSLGDIVDPSIQIRKVSITVPSLAAAKEEAKAAALSKPLVRSLAKGKESADVNEALYEVRIAVRFNIPATAQPDSALQQAKAFQEKLTQVFPGHDVTAVQLPINIRTQILEGTAKQGASGPLPNLPTAEYLVRKKS